MDNDLILYSTADGKTKINLRETDGTVWLTQAQIAELFDTTPQNITLHIKAIYADNEIDEKSTCKNYLQVQNAATQKTTHLKNDPQATRKELAELVGITADGIKWNIEKLKKSGQTAPHRWI